MLTRIYIDNFRCFANFEWRLGRRQLIMGANGAGKSSLLDAILLIRRLVTLGQDLDSQKILPHRTLWMSQTNLTYEFEASLDDSSYVYQLVIGSHGEPQRAFIVLERLTAGGKIVFNFEGGAVRLFDDQRQDWVAYPFDHHRSALATITEAKVNQNIARFRKWFRNLLCFRIDPFAIKTQANVEESYPWRDLSNFSAWYRHLRLSHRDEDDSLHQSLRNVFDGFKSLQFEDFGSGTRLLQAEFVQDGRSLRLAFNQLSDGQKCLIGLYAILHFVIAKGHTVILDEPDNFIALREIQPWLSEVSASLDEGRGQVLIISHHPELLDQWAPDYGVRFVREGMSPVRVKEFSGQGYSMLTPSEIVARGWENE